MDPNDTSTGEAQKPLEALEIMRSAGLPPIWADHTQLSLRKDIPIGMLTFLSMLPGGPGMEVARIQCSINHLKQLSELITTLIAEHEAKDDKSEGEPVP